MQADDDTDDDQPAGVVSFVPHSANKYPKQKKARTASSTDKAQHGKAPQAPRTLLKAGELVHVATDVPLAAQHAMFGAVDSSTFQVRKAVFCELTCLLRHKCEVAMHMYATA